MTQTIKKDFSSRAKPDLATLVYGKVPPQATEMEVAVLGACMLEKDTFEKVMEIIYSPECFYMDAHQKIYKAMCLLYNSGFVVDLLTVVDALKKSGELELVGGKDYLSYITTFVLSTAHVVQHAMIVMENFFKREVIRICGQAINYAYDDSSDCFELMENVETEVRGLTDGIIGGTTVPVSRTNMEILASIKKQRELKSEVIGIQSGFIELDALTLGWCDTDLIILAARPSQGKTAFAVNFAQNAALKDVHVLLFSLESSNASLVRRMLAAKNSIPLEQLRTGNINDFQEQLLYSSAAEFNKLPIEIDSKSRSINAIKKVSRKWAKKVPKGKKKLILIDYLQLINIIGKGNREQEISSISRDLKELAMEFELPIIALSQLNRDVEKTATKKPGLHHLRESGAIEQDANIVMFVYWEEQSGGEKQLYILVCKNRDGKCGEVKLKMNGDFQKILNMDDFNQSVYPSFIRNPSEPNNNYDEPF